MKNCKYFKAKGIDYKGQLQKIQKSNNKLQPLYEALTNSIEAIKLLEDNNKKEIFIKLFLVPKLFSDETNDFELSKLIIKDYGVGFNDKEFERFTKLHDNSKGYNNQGSGRIQYMHFFENTKFESIYFDEKSSTKYYQRNFWLSKSDTFIGNDAIICYEEPFEVNVNQSETTITFQNFLDEEDSKYYNCLTPWILKENFKEHYLYYFCENRDNIPNINIQSFLNNKELELEIINQNDIPQEDKTELIKIKYKRLSDKNKIIQTDEEEFFYIKSFKLDKNMLTTNDLKLTSKHEIVRGKFDKKFELTILKPEDIIENNRYLFLVSSEYIDKRDTDIRGELNLYTDEEYKNDSSLFKEKQFISINDIQQEVNTYILTMYPEILENKKKHEIDVEKLKNMFLLDEEVLKKIKINVQDTDEKILKKVYEYDAKIKAEKDAKIKAEIESLKELNPADSDYENTLNEKVTNLVKQIPMQNRTALSHYVARRKLVLDLFSQTLERELEVQKASKRNIDEKLLHNIIFQQSSNNPEESDLWMVNEEFIYFDGTSEEHLGKIELNGESIFKENLNEEEEEYRLKQQGDANLKRPDILLFPNEGKCIIIEFKSPEVNVTDHLNQINKYASLINNLSKDKFKFNSYYGYLIGENIDIDDIRDNDSDFLNAPHFEFIYRPFKRIVGKFGKQDSSLYTEVIKYSTLLKRAKKRNEIFIKKLGLLVK